jgi:aspartate racemase
MSGISGSGYQHSPRYNAVGIIGGLGSVASADVFFKMTRFAAAMPPARRVEILFDQKPFKEPDIAGAENAYTNARKLYVFDMVRQFEERCAAAVALPCFISHTFLDELQVEVGLPIVDMLAAIRRHLETRLPKLQRVGVLTSSYVRKKQLFQKYFPADQYELLFPSDAVQHACVMRAVYGAQGIKHGCMSGNTIDLLYEACQDLLRQGAQVILPGMTEVAMVADALIARGIPLIDTNQVYAESVIAYEGVVARQFKIGVVGGVGPAATVDFIGKVIRNTPAEKDQDHIKLVVEQNPQIPDRTQNLVADGPDPTVAIYAACKRLENDNADIIAIPCNTAHAFVERIQAHLSVPIINMLDETVGYVARQYGQPCRIGLLATAGTIASTVYHEAAQRLGMQLVTPAPEQQEQVMQIIYGEYGVKAGFVNDDLRLALIEQIGLLAQQGADVVILGCTELPLLMHQNEAFEVNGKCVPVLDPTEILARRCVSLAQAAG